MPHAWDRRTHRLCFFFSFIFAELMTLHTRPKRFARGGIQMPSGFSTNMCPQTHKQPLSMYVAYGVARKQWSQVSMSGCNSMPVCGWPIGIATSLPCSSAIGGGLVVWLWTNGAASELNADVSLLSPRCSRRRGFMLDERRRLSLAGAGVVPSASADWRLGLPSSVRGGNSHGGGPIPLSNARCGKSLVRCVSGGASELVRALDVGPLAACVSWMLASDGPAATVRAEADCKT